MHHLSKTIFLFKHWNHCIETSGEGLTKNKEECKVEGEEDLDDLIDILTICYDCDDYSVRDEELNDHI